VRYVSQKSATFPKRRLPLPRFVFEEEVDWAIAKRLHAHPTDAPHHCPYHSQSEPSRVVHLRTDRAAMPTGRRARLMRLATLRSVDSYFHKIRTNIKAVERPVAMPSGNGRFWDRRHLYKPGMMVKIVEIYRFHHNWMGAGNQYRGRRRSLHRSRRSFCSGPSGDLYSGLDDSPYMSNIPLWSIFVAEVEKPVSRSRPA